MLSSNDEKSPNGFFLAKSEGFETGKTAGAGADAGAGAGAETEAGAGGGGATGACLVAFVFWAWGAVFFFTASFGAILDAFAVLLD